MKRLLSIFLLLALLPVASLAEEANGLRVTVQKTLLEKEKNRDQFYTWDKVAKALGLKVNARNISFKDMPEGVLEFNVIVKRWGRSTEVFESYTGTEKLPLLLKGAEANLVVGKVPIGGWESSGNRKEFQDSIEGWQVKITHDGKETIKITSNQDFEKVAKKATPGKPPKAAEK